MTVFELEAIVFVAGSEGISLADLAEAFDIEDQEMESLVREMVDVISTSTRPYIPVVSKEVVRLVTKPEYSNLISKVKQTLDKSPLSKSQLELVSLLAYRGPSTKVDIDTLRGVNSVQPIKTLLLRGMIERAGESHGSTIYTLTQDFWEMIGVVDPSNLPEFAELHTTLVN